MCHEIDNFRKLFLPHNICNYMLSLSDEDPGVMKNIPQDIMHFLFMTYGQAIAQKSLYRGS